MNPYDRTKLFLEEIARDIPKADTEWMIIFLRVAAHVSGKVGEDPKGIPNNLMPYPTPDGSAIRYYIQVMDLAEGHVVALQKLLEKEYPDNIEDGEERECRVLQHFLWEGTYRDYPYEELHVVLIPGATSIVKIVPADDDVKQQPMVETGESPIKKTNGKLKQN